MTMYIPNEELFSQVVDEYFELGRHLHKSNRDIKIEIVNDLWKALLDRATGKKKPGPVQELPMWLVAEIVFKLYHVADIHWDTPTQNKDSDGLSDVERAQKEKETHAIGIYDEATGIYALSQEYLESIAMQFRKSYTDSEYRQFMRRLYDLAPDKHVCRDTNLVPVNNGVFDYQAQKLLEYSPDRVYLNKSQVDYVHKPKNPVFCFEDGTSWDVESWMLSIAESPEQAEFLWQILGATLRPAVPWDKAIMLLSESGNNGKGTFCRLVRNLVGASATTELSIQDFGDEFGLHTLLHTQLVIADENDTSTYLANAARFKSIITGDPIRVNRKNRDHQRVQFRGLVIQCLNGLPRFRDKSASLKRRLLFVPFTKRFEGIERKEIKADFLGRAEVLEYVMWRALSGMKPYDKLVPPESSASALGDFETSNDAVREFAELLLNQTRWEFLPSTFVYDLYKKWLRSDNPEGKVEGKKRFFERFRMVIAEYPQWEERVQPVSVANLMDDEDPLVIDYGGPDFRWYKKHTTQPHHEHYYNWGGKRYRGWELVHPSDDDVQVAAEADDAQHDALAAVGAPSELLALPAGASTDRVDVIDGEVECTVIVEYGPQVPRECESSAAAVEIDTAASSVEDTSSVDASPSEPVSDEPVAFISPAILAQEGVDVGNISALPMAEAPDIENLVDGARALLPVRDAGGYIHWWEPERVEGSEHWTWVVRTVAHCHYTEHSGPDRDSRMLLELKDGLLTWEAPPNSHQGGRRARKRTMRVLQLANGHRTIVKPSA